ncbi:MAG: hypothetical protein K1X73_01715 [Bacteroidia bacterium]|nr:hypothetical protein [Bacteroidia bacterium]HMX96712.1 hypothetical protein [Bacteroidia bacterium]HNF40277.1 hypothetical protein [Bacteroidia bacterium]
MTVYNIKRAKNILGFDKLMEVLKNWTPKYPGDTCFSKIRLHISHFRLLNFLQHNLAA